ncbi:MAG TPA: glycosyltransferase family 2 protein [Saprospiraceae bacterium]|nr:glycosyltransferase family 2 protein [Saprospiraceae bacterium]
MKVSIITSTYNSASTLRDTLESIANQSYTTIEHIIIDGLSTDSTLDIVKDFTHVAKVISEHDKGIYDAMNKGIDHATGEIIGILNSDDFYTYQNALQDVVAVFKENEVDCVYADLDYVDQKDTSKVVRKWKSGNFHQDSFSRGWMPPHPTFFVKKHIYEKYGTFNLEMGTAADYELMLRFLEKHQCSVAYLPKTIINMRTGGASNMSFSARLKANRMDQKAWKINGLKPSLFTTVLKPLRKIVQYLP